MTELLQKFGPWAMGFMIFIDDAGMPIFPNGIALFSAAIFCRAVPESNVWIFFITAVLAAQTGNAILFFAGKRGLQKWAQNHHLWFLPSADRLEKFRNFFQRKHGTFTILAISMITTFRPFGALAAGSTGMRGTKFFPFNFLGIVIWATVVTLSGYFLSEPLLTAAQKDGKILIAALVVIAAYWYFWKWFPRKYFRTKRK
ncbi:DedA family protein [bacterium]|jgi:membrane protein DedA with SNARE-associated domain|nr:DedA family protein [bacterium]MBT6831781.1 DedA family protein [bacterium]MBT6995988.1 DedA family protein [bacterium]MBT7772641.1 DedA family protein [bacterium]